MYDVYSTNEMELTVLYRFFDARAITDRKRNINI